MESTRPLSERSIRQLCLRAQGGSHSAQDQLLRAHMRLIVHVANSFYRPGYFCEMADLVQQGCLGLLRAIVKFKPSTFSRGKRVRFATYAHYWVSHFIRREIENNGRTIAIPVHKLKEYKTQGSDASGPRAYSLDQLGLCLEDAGDPALVYLVNPNDNSDHWMKSWEIRQEIEQLLAPLPSRKRDVLRYRYGLNEIGEPLTQRETAQTLKVSPSLVGCLERSSLFKLRGG